VTFAHADGDMASYMCPACGYPGLLEPPHAENGAASDEICPACGIHFGYEDEIGCDENARASYYRGWGGKWHVDGARWWSSRASPADWDGEAQFQVTLGVAERGIGNVEVHP
jgi:hypothetical protein